MKQNDDVIHECGEIAAKNADEINKIHVDYEKRIIELEARLVESQTRLAHWKLACEQYKD